MPYGIQQPAISGQLAQLEKELSVKLFHRRPFGLTSSGARLFAEIEPFFGGLAELRSQVRGHANQRLRIAAPAMILRGYLPKMLAEYKQRYRDFRLVLHDANQASAEELLRKHEIDLAITELEGKPVKPIKSCVLIRLPLVLLAPLNTTEKTTTELFRKGVASESLISLPSDEVISKNFQAGLRKMRTAWPSQIEVSSLELVNLYTSLGLGFGVSVTAPGLEPRRDVRVLPLRNFAPVTIAALWIGELSEIAASFLNDLKDLAKQLAR